MGEEFDDEKMEISNTLLLSCFQNDKARILTILNQNEDLEISKIIDAKGFTSKN